jgi:poly(A) polymerase
MIDEEALKILYRLHRNSFLAYLVGGSVRDLLLGKVPKDFDVVTNAHPHQINSLFRNSRTIGHRFRLVHVFFKGRKIVEVSTFRSHSEFEEIATEEGKIIRTESFGTPAEDALRRDITINGLFYNIADFSIIDYIGGMADLKSRMIRTIGNPDERFQHDPVRMIRVIRHAARTGFSIDHETYRALVKHRNEIKKCSPSRVRDEFLRDLREGVVRSSLDLMLRTRLLFSLFPDLETVFGERNPFADRDRRSLLSLFALTDQMAQSGKPLPDSVLIALFLTPFIARVMPDHPFLGERERYGYFIQGVRWAAHQVLNPFSFPKGVKEMACQILTAQAALERTVERNGVPKRLKGKKYFEEAVLLFGIKAEAQGRKVPPCIRTAVASDLLPWWPTAAAKKSRRPGRRRRRNLLHQQVGKPEGELWK